MHRGPGDGGPDRHSHAAVAVAVATRNVDDARWCSARWRTARRGVLAAGALILGLGLGLSGCASYEPADLSPSASPRPSTSPTQQETGDVVNETSVRLTVGDQTLDATVWDTPTGRDLLSRLPLTLTFEDYGGQEKTGRLDRELTMAGMPAGAAPRTGDLGYYAPGRVLVLYTSDVGFWNGIARIGRIDGDLSVITSRSDDFTVTIDLAG